MDKINQSKIDIMIKELDSFFPAIRKKRHHYVWKKYLKEWAGNNRKIWCSTNHEKPIERPLIKVAFKFCFYSLENIRLTSEELNLIEYVINNSNEKLKRQNEFFLEQYRQLVFYVDNYGSSIPSALLDRINIFLNNLIEDYHAEIERKLGRFLECIKNKDSSFFAEKFQKISFIRCLTNQYTRTFKQELDGFKEKNINMDNVRPFIQLILANNIGVTLLKSNFVLMINQTSTAFITGDQPVVNIHHEKKGVIPDDFELYYPVSPSVAVLLSDDSKYLDVKELFLNSVEDVMKYNQYIFRGSDSQLYSNSKESLEIVSSGS
jgi:hypothetical protein